MAVLQLPLLRLLREYWRQRRAARAPAAQHRTEQETLLLRLCEYAYQHSVYYRELFDNNGLTPTAIRSIDDFAQLPVAAKVALRDAGTKLRSDDITLGRLTEEKSSGSTGSPFVVAFDRDYLLNRNLRFLRGLWAAGYRWPMPLLLVTGTKERNPSRWMRWHYASIKVSPAESLATYESVRPRVVYGCVTPLRELALALLQHGTSVPAPRSVITTAETLDQNTRQLLQRAFGCEVFDFYGMTEMGLVGWECRAHAGYHLALDSVLVEQVPLGDDSGRCQLIYTNLALRGTPLLRYVSGDIGYGYTTARCDCGSSLPRLQRIEGREVDVITLPDGRRCSPYQFTCELEKLAELRRYKVIQEAADSIRVIAESVSRHANDELRQSNDELRQRIGAVVAAITGPKVRLQIELVDAIPHPPGTKYRVVENRTRSTCN